ncbi:Uncharacterised protein [uncultured archaeon]|nr:Uncharacterised protein [uncultured archaeon]
MNGRGRLEGSLFIIASLMLLALGSSVQAQGLFGAPCHFTISLNPDSQFYVRPTNITLSYVIKESSVTCFPSTGNFTGSLTFLDGATGIAYGRIPLSIPIGNSAVANGTIAVNAAYISSTGLPNYAVIANIYLKGSNFDNQTSAHFYLATRANVTINNVAVVPAGAAVGSILSLTGNFTNTGQLAATNASLFVTIVGPSGSVQNISQSMGKLRPGERRAFSINLRNAAQSSGKYAIQALAKYNDVSTFNNRAHSDVHISNEATTEYVVVGTSEINGAAGFPAPPTSLGPLIFTSLPLYASIQAYNSTSMLLSMSNPTNYTVRVNVSAERLPNVTVVPSGRFLIFLSNETKSEQILISTDGANIAGTYVVPINLTATYVADKVAHTIDGQFFIIVRVKPKEGNVIQTRLAYLSSPGRNVSNQYTVYNPLNGTAYRIAFDTELPFSSVSNTSKIHVSKGQGAFNITASLSGAYNLQWDLAQLGAHKEAVFSYYTTNTSDITGLLNPVTALSSSLNNISSLTLLNTTIHSVQTNNTGKSITVYEAYSGNRPTNVTYFLALVSPSTQGSPHIFNAYHSVMESNDSISAQTFDIESTATPGVYQYRLVILGPGISQSYPIYLNITAGPPQISVFEQNLIVGLLVITVLVSVFLAQIYLSYMSRKKCEVF